MNKFVIFSLFSGAALLLEVGAYGMSCPFVYGRLVESLAAAETGISAVKADELAEAICAEIVRPKTKPSPTDQGLLEEELKGLTESATKREVGYNSRLYTGLVYDATGYQDLRTHIRGVTAAYLTAASGAFDEALIGRCIQEKKKDVSAFDSHFLTEPVTSWHNENTLSVLSELSDYQSKIITISDVVFDIIGTSVKDPRQKHNLKSRARSIVEDKVVYLSSAPLGEACRSRISYEQRPSEEVIFNARLASSAKPSVWQCVVDERGLSTAAPSAAWTSSSEQKTDSLNFVETISEHFGRYVSTSYPSQSADRTRLFVSDWIKLPGLKKDFLVFDRTSRSSREQADFVVGWYLGELGRLLSIYQAGLVYLLEVELNILYGQARLSYEGSCRGDLGAYSQRQLNQSMIALNKKLRTNVLKIAKITDSIYEQAFLGDYLGESSDIDLIYDYARRLERAREIIDHRRLRDELSSPGQGQ